MNSTKLNINQIKQKASDFQNCKNINHLAQLLGVQKNEISLTIINPFYIHFTVPKKNGKLRHIEAPEIGLKRLQRKLNTYLQCFYYINQSDASYGYIIKPKRSKATKNIKTNAEVHLGSSYMINADFEDFFHQIRIDNVLNIFKSKYFSFDNTCALALTKLCTYKNRLPMGAPTSPALSNIYSIGLDTELNNWAMENSINFSRYVDDLSFSSKNEIGINEFNTIKTIALKHQLKFNETKTKIYNPTDKKTVTGLVINETIDIDQEFYIELENDIKRLKHTIEAIFIADRTNNVGFLKQFKQEIKGKINFIASIEGYNSPEYLNFQTQYDKALQPNENLLIRWTKFSNYM